MIKIVHGKIIDLKDFQDPLAPAVKNLYLDLDGTLLGSHSLTLKCNFIRHAMIEVSRIVGLRNAPATLRAIRKSVESEQTSEILNNHQRAVQSFAEATGQPLEIAETSYRTIIDRIFSRLEKSFYPMEDALKFLDWATNRYNLTLATNPVWPKSIVEKRLAWGKITPTLFSKITHSESMHSCKPRVSYYTELLQSRSHEARDVMHIGNDFRKDYPAIEAGIPVFILSSTPLSRVSEYIRKHGSVVSSATPCWVGNFSDLRKTLSRTHYE